ncbi:TetR/AcrR family transcriptional regulator [Paracoccus methylarcula]|uniref:TetR/AcrR family transcriptional regulator n=1 Tax=Paracoccus methylarcula TaxID=72022 RepID=A0A3R7LK35_9RHOB|nr:TetR/AcrR family transcriptional regulator [Paracoccus methylarcula]RNF34596.1 TetR/AcrR family transcriptional regulator [Paracoccus methylarcula]
MARPRHYDHDELRTAIIEAARKLLEEGGPAALTARALAKAVGTTPGTIYNLFSNMNAVLHEVNRRTFTELAQMIDAAPPAAPRDRLLALADGYVDFMLARRVVWRGLFEGPHQTDTFPGWYTSLIDELIDRIAAPIAQLQPRASARLLAEELFLSVHGVVALAAIERLDLVTTQDPHSLARSAVERMLNWIEVDRR